MAQQPSKGISMQALLERKAAMERERMAAEENIARATKMQRDRIEKARQQYEAAYDDGVTEAEAEPSRPPSDPTSPAEVVTHQVKMIRINGKDYDPSEIFVENPFSLDFLRGTIADPTGFASMADWATYLQRNLLVEVAVTLPKWQAILNKSTYWDKFIETGEVPEEVKKEKVKPRHCNDDGGDWICSVCWSPPCRIGPMIRY